jgi:hypothetical protein
MQQSGFHRTVGAVALQEVPGGPPRTEFPANFQGIFAEVRDKHGELFVQARESLRFVPMVEEFRPYFLHGVLGHAQPSFMLLALMHLALADELGGVNEYDRAYLPWNILLWEHCAILDDTLDRTPYRSGRKTYVHEFGEPSSTAMVNYLFSLVVGRSAEVSTALIPLISDYYCTFSSLLVYEFHSRYPAATVPACERWLKLHYDAMVSALELTFNGPLALRGLPFMPRKALQHASEIMQDVDDLVNFLEQRERAGENDDIKLGNVSHALLHALRSHDATAPALEALWRLYRRIPQRSLDGFWAAYAQCGAETVPEYEAIASLVNQHGVLATANKVIEDARACVRATPEPLRRCMGEIVGSFIGRLRSVDALPPSSRETLSRSFMT